jgi:hypothetical protein
MLCNLTTDYESLARTRCATYQSNRAWARLRAAHGAHERNRHDHSGFARAGRNIEGLGVTAGARRGMRLDDGGITGSAGILRNERAGVDREGRVVLVPAGRDNQISSEACSNRRGGQ